MQVTNITKRKYFTKSKKLAILNELQSGAITHSDLARKHQVHPVTLYQWRRQMGSDKPEEQADYQELLEENDDLKKQIELLKKAVGELAIDKQILQTANDILKKAQRRKKLGSPKRSSKK
jgi:transposase-like protein